MKKGGVKSVELTVDEKKEDSSSAECRKTLPRVIHSTVLCDLSAYYYVVLLCRLKYVLLFLE